MQKQLILIVDDTPENVELLHAALADDYRTKFAVSGEKALRIANADPQPDLILLDVMMPGMDGYEVCRALKDAPATRDIPVIFVTALREVKDEKKGLDLGAVDYITKPISQAIVLARVRTHLALKNALVEQRRTGVRLKQTLSELELIMEHAALGVLMVVRSQGERLIMRASRAMEQMLGYAPGGLEGRDTREIAPSDEEYREFEDVYDSILMAGRPHVCDHVLRRKCGKTILTHMVGVAIDPKDLSKGAIWLVEDITERHSAEMALQASNADLTAALASLKMAQSELLRTEKLAALGSLVAGIAHELNTPIGNALMVASTMHEQTGQFAKALAKGIRRSELESFLNDTLSANDIMLRNLSRAAEQVSSFKQVAVDQTSSQRRRFRLAEIVAEIVVTLRPTFKKTPYRVEYEIPQSIEMDSLPGPLGQVITNLINNSILHGFGDRPSGLIRLKAQLLDPNWLELQVIDDGVGIAATNVDKIFDPFFTTKLGHGGSGLGLSIVHTIVTEVLGGKIDVVSDPDQGTIVSLRLPLVAPSAKGRATEQVDVA